MRHFKLRLLGMLLGTLELMPLIIAFNCQVIEQVHTFANPVLKHPGIYEIMERYTGKAVEFSTTNQCTNAVSLKDLVHYHRLNFTYLPRPFKFISKRGKFLEVTIFQFKRIQKHHENQS